MMRNLAVLTIALAIVVSGCGNAPTETETVAAVTQPVPTSNPEAAEPDPAAPAPVMPVAANAGTVGVDGAVQFALALTSFTQFLMYSESNTALAVTEANTTPAGYDAVRETILTDIGPLRTSMSDLPPGELWFKTAPLSHRVVDATETTATVEVWSVTVVARAHMIEPTANYSTTTYRIVWSDTGRWLLDGFSDELGPSPASDFTAERAALTDLTEGLKGHRLTLPPLFEGTP